MKYMQKGMVALFICLLFAFPYTGANNFHIQVLTTAATMSIIAMGYNILFGLTGQISVGHAAFYAVGGYASVVLTNQFKFPLFLAMILGMFMATLLALVVGYPLLRLRGNFLALGTIGFGIIVYTILMTAQKWTGGPSGIPVAKTIVLGYTFNQRSFYFLALVLAIITYVICKRMTYSYIGRALKSIREDEEAAQAMGIRVAYYKLLAFVFSAVLAAMAGCIYPLANGFITPELYGIGTSIRFLTFVVIGGLGNSAGGILGALLLTLLPQVITSLQEFELLIYAVIMFLILRFMPGGLVSIFSKDSKIFMWVKKRSGIQNIITKVS